MPTVPIKESGDNFGHKDANVPFAIEDAVVSAGDLDVTVGDGRIVYGDVVYELDTGGTGTVVSALAIPAAVDNYYVTLDFNAGSPTLVIITTPPASQVNTEIEYLGYVTTTATPTVDTITDLRSMLPPSSGFRGLDGAASTPTFGFANDPDTGIFLSTTNAVGFTSAGTEIAKFDSSGLGMLSGSVRIQSGTDADPGLKFGNDVDTGMYRFGADVIGFTTGGSVALLIGDGSSTFADNVRFQDGQVNLPGITFQNDTDTGIWLKATGNMAISTSGTEIVNYSTTRVSFQSDIWAPDGSAGNPSITFTNESNSGLYYDGVTANRVYYGAGGVEIGYWDTNYFALTRSGTQFRAPDGSGSAPSYTFGSELDTGIYRYGNNAVGMVTGGVPTWAFQPNEFRPNTNNDYDIGIAATAGPREIYHNGLTSLSDMRGKKDVLPVPSSESEAIVKAIRNAGAVTFRRKEGNDGDTSVETNRKNRGLVAQDLKASLQAAGLDTEALISEPNPTEEFPEPRMGIRYTEAIPDIAVALANALDRIEALENA